MLQISLKIDGKLTEAHGVNHLASLKKASASFLISASDIYTCAHGRRAIRDVKDAAGDVSWRPPDSNVPRNTS